MLELLKQTRSYRRFIENKKISDTDLRDIASAMRYCASGGNLQRLRVALVSNPDECRGVFDSLAFAAYLRPLGRPDEGERPVAYAVLMTDVTPDSTVFIDAGIAAEAMLLVAREKGIGGCIFRSFSESGIDAALGREGYHPVLVIALGYPAEEVVIEDVSDGNIRYYRDENGVHHVPKRSVDELII